ncbi:hypothetical protein OAA15_00415 [bacterium]|nr:hypothetical protein [bacterium]
MNDFNIKKFLTENKMTRNSRLLKENTLNEELTYQFSEYDFDVKGNHEFYSKVVEIVKSNSNYPYMTDREIDINIEKTADYHYGEARKANKNSREYPPMTAEEFAQSVIDNMVPNPKHQ